MFGGIWRSELTIGFLTPFVVLGVLMAIGPSPRNVKVPLKWEPSQSEQRPSQSESEPSAAKERQQPAESQKDTETQKAERVPSAIAKGTVPKKDNEADKKGDAESKGEQKGWTDFTLTDALIALFTAVLTVVAGLQAYYTWGTMVATAAARAASWCRCGQAHSRPDERDSRAELRAYVNHGEGNVINFDGPHPLVQVVFKNFGQTPAYKLRRRVNFLVTAVPRSAPFPEIDADTQFGGALVPEATPFWGALTICSFPNRQRRNQDGQRGLYVFGDVTYEDAFGKERLTTFRLLYGGGEMIHPAGNLASCEEGNEAT
jgi:hypothetical protein